MEREREREMEAYEKKDGKIRQTRYRKDFIRDCLEHEYEKKK